MATTLLTPKNPRKIATIALLFIFILIVISALSGCITEKKRRAICYTCSSKIVKKDSIIYIHDTVKVKIAGAPGPIRYLENPCKTLCDSIGNLRQIDIKDKKNGQILSIKTVGNSLAISTERGDTTLNVPITDIKTFSSVQTDTPKYIPCEHERTAFDGFCRWFTYIVGSAGIIFLGIWYVRRRLKKPISPI